MSSSGNSSIASWERQLNEHQDLCLQAARTKDFTVIPANAAVDTLSASDHKTALRAALGDNKPEYQVVLDDLNVQKCETIKAAIIEYNNVVTINEKSGNNRFEWEQLLYDQETKAIEMVADKIKVTNQSAKAVISSLAPDVRDTAANIFVQGSGAAMQAFNTLTNELAKVLSRVVEFVKGIFTAMQNAYNAVTGAVKSAIDFIKGIFSATLDGGVDNIVMSNVVSQTAAVLDHPSTVPPKKSEPGHK